MSNDARPQSGFKKNEKKKKDARFSKFENIPEIFNDDMSR